VESGWKQEKKSPFKPVVRTAEEPKQAINVDLCFVPAEHEVEIKLPAVSGSSGRLVVERLAGDEEPQYPGRIFEDPSLDYAEAMQAFVAASAQQGQSEDQQPRDDAKSSRKATMRHLRQEQDNLRIKRRNVRTRRKQEDIAWKALRQQHRQEEIEFSQRRAKYGERKTWKQGWKTLREHRRQVLAQRRQEDEVWRQQRQRLRAKLAELPIVTSWIAILVITDNCTRQCLGLPLFVAGAKVTSQMIVNALRSLLPPELQFLISDRGVHFTAQAFKELAQTEEFIHVVIARHRPQSNGIAERFVRTLKEWLATRPWGSDPELLTLLAEFRTEYNNRPHQGLAIPGLSPNEFANRIWLF
jgi:transposase InsO family protein